MIDLHSHILAGVDDGASNIEESLKIIQNMEAKGVKKVTATSHYPLYQEKDYKNYISEKLELLKNKVKAAQINVEILSGAEILINRKIPELLHNKHLFTINETDYILLETHFNSLPDYFSDLIHDLKVMGYKIIIAHPERYAYIHADFSKLYQWVENYELKLMLNSSSLVGRHGSKSKELAEKMINLGLCHLMASDTHGLKKRTFTLDQGLNRAEEFKPGSKEVFKKNAEAVLQNQSLKNFEIKREEKPFFEKIFSFI